MNESSLAAATASLTVSTTLILPAIGAVGVTNLMYAVVRDRTQEIGIKMAIGATPRRILTEFFLESLVLTLGSGVVGVVFAVVVSQLVAQLPLPQMFAGLPITRLTACVAFFTLVLVGILAAMYPARRASQLTPVDALRYE